MVLFDGATVCMSVSSFKVCTSESTSISWHIITKDFSDAWIGLQRTLSGHNWNTAVNCQANSATYQAWNQTSESLLKSSYLFDASSNTWQSMYYNSTANAAVCRLGTLKSYMTQFTKIR